MNIPECPICLDLLSIPVYQCVDGHSICNKCSYDIVNCPICRVAFKRESRNQALELLIFCSLEKCPHLGCDVTLAKAEMTEHVEDCPLQPISCTSTRCTWTGSRNEIGPHFQACHKLFFLDHRGSVIVIENFNINFDSSYVYLVMHEKLPFILTLKADAVKKICYWVVQKVGSIKSALEYFYIIHVNSLGDHKRKAEIADDCFNELKKSEEIMETGKCAIMPLESLLHFIKDGKLSFKVFINKVNVQTKSTQQ